MRWDDSSVATYTELLLIGPRGSPWILNAVPSSWRLLTSEKISISWAVFSLTTLHKDKRRSNLLNFNFNYYKGVKYSKIHIKSPYFLWQTDRNGSYILEWEIQLNKVFCMFLFIGWKGFVINLLWCVYLEFTAHHQNRTSLSHACSSAANTDITSASVNPCSVKAASLFLVDLDVGLMTEHTKASRRGTTRGWSGVLQQQICL